MIQEFSRYKELYIWQILEGDASIGMPEGIIDICKKYMDLKSWSTEKRDETNNYLTFLAQRARG